MPRVDVSMTDGDVHHFLREPRTGVLSTIGRDGFPHMSAMWFVVDADRISMWAYEKSQKVVNARRDARAAFLVEEGLAYHELRGVLARGTLQIVEGYEDIRAIGRRLYERYTLPATGVALQAGPEAEIDRQAGKRVGLTLPLTRVASWDHRKLFE